MHTTPPAFVLGGYEAGLAVVRSLGRAGIPVVSVRSSERETAGYSRSATTTAVAPDPADSPREYAEALLALAERHGPGVVFPTTDEALEAVAAHHDALAERHLLACPPEAVAQGFLDKRYTAEIADREQVDGPRTAVPGSPEELEDLLRELQFPCLAKPRESYRYNRAFGTKMKRAENADELRAAWGEAHALGIGMLIQELIPGPETGGINYNVYMVDGEPCVEFTSRKQRLSPANFGYPCAVVSAEVPEVVEPGRRIVRGLGIEGFANVEFKQDERDGRYKLMEVNGRPNMSGQLAVRCGVDFPLMTYRHLVHGLRPTQRPWSTGVHWTNDLTDVRVAARRLRAGGLPVREGLAPYATSHVFATFSLTDPEPFLARIGKRLDPRSVKTAPSSGLKSV